MRFVTIDLAGLISRSTHSEAANLSQLFIAVADYPAYVTVPGHLGPPRVKGLGSEDFLVEDNVVVVVVVAAAAVAAAGLGS